MQSASEPNLGDYISKEVEKIIQAFDFPKDTYALQLYIDCQSDPRFPPLDVYFNSLQQADRSTPTPTSGRGFPIASSQTEAKWNFAFWLQQSAGQIFGPDDTEGNRRKELWLRDCGLWYSDEEESADVAAITPRMEQMGQAFWRLVGRSARKLHDNGFITRKFGKPIPLLVVELEFDDFVVECTRLANPEELIQDFIHSCDV